MDNTEYESEVARRVYAAINETFGSVNGGAKAAAIPYATLDRKLKLGGSFTVAELRRIAKATGRRTSDLLPTESAAEMSRAA